MNAAGRERDDADPEPGLPRPAAMLGKRAQRLFTGDSSFGVDRGEDATVAVLCEAELDAADPNRLPAVLRPSEPEAAGGRRVEQRPGGYRRERHVTRLPEETGPTAMKGEPMILRLERLQTQLPPPSEP